MPEVRLEFFSVKQRVFLVKHFYQSFGDYKLVRNDYETFYKNCQISEAAISELIELFENTGSVLKSNHFGRRETLAIQKSSQNNTVTEVRNETITDDPLEDLDCLPSKEENCEEELGEIPQESHQERIKVIKMKNFFAEETLSYIDDDEAKGQSEQDKIPEMGQCEKCGKKYRKTLSGHKCFLYKCTYCRMKFPRKDMQKHMRKNHSSKKIHKCEFCGKLFLRRDDLASHKRIHTKEKPFMCRVEGCFERFHWRQALKRHEQAYHIRDNSQIFHCSFCPATYRLQEYLVNHMKRWHRWSGEVNKICESDLQNQEHKPYVCSVPGCQKSFFWRQSLRRHQNCHTANRRKDRFIPDEAASDNLVVKCENCRKEYNFNEVHNCEISTLVNCVFCQEKIPKESLTDHISSLHRLSHPSTRPVYYREKIQVQTNNQDAPTKIFTCKICGKTCTRKYDLKSHEKVHSSARPYVCQIDGCQKSFAWQQSLRRHERTHNKDKTKFPCDHCRALFLTKYDHSLHMFQDHQCYVCKEFIRDPEEMDIHREFHKNHQQIQEVRIPELSPTSEMSFICNLCDKVFLSKKNLQFHRSLAHPESPAEESPRPKGPKSPGAPCHVCGIVFPTYPALKEHLENHSSSQEVQ